MTNHVTPVLTLRECDRCGDSFRLQGVVAAETGERLCASCRREVRIRVYDERAVQLAVDPASVQMADQLTEAWKAARLARGLT